MRGDSAVSAFRVVRTSARRVAAWEVVWERCTVARGRHLGALVAGLLELVTTAVAARDHVAAAQGDAVTASSAMDRAIS